MRPGGAIRTAVECAEQRGEFATAGVATARSAQVGRRQAGHLSRGMLDVCGRGEAVTIIGSSTELSTVPLDLTDETLPTDTRDLPSWDTEFRPTAALLRGLVAR